MASYRILPVISDDAVVRVSSAVFEREHDTIDGK